MDNFHIDIVCEGDNALKLAVKIAFTQHRKAVAFRICEKNGLVIYWMPGKGSQPLPYAYDADDVALMATKWLQEQSYGSEPDHDGDNGRGWRVYNEEWGHVDDDYAAFLAIKPAWAMYGK